MARFNVYHLAETEQKTFILTPRQRYDQSIVDEYCITKRQVQLAKEKPQESPEEYMLKIAKQSLSLWSNRSYCLVAEVKAKDIAQAFRNTKNINGHWFLTKASGVKVLDKSVIRETQQGDIIEDLNSGNKYMVYSYTFMNINTGALI